jgi:hypothetical protein
MRDGYGRFTIADLYQHPAETPGFGEEFLARSNVLNSEEGANMGAEI